MGLHSIVVIYVCRNSTMLASSQVKIELISLSLRSAAAVPFLCLLAL